MTSGRRLPRALLATRIFAPEPAAASFRLAALVRALSEKAEVTILTVTEPSRAATRMPSTVKIRRWPVLRDRTGYMRGYLPYASFDVPLALRLLLAPRPHVVVVEPPPTTGVVVRAVCAIRRVPYVYNAADVWSDAAESTGSPGIVVRLLRVLERWAVRGASAVLSVSDGVSERVRELGATNVVTVGNGVDTEVFTPDGGRRGEGHFLLYAGTASEWQGAEVFVRAMPRVLEEITDAKLVFLGQGSSWPTLQIEAERLDPGAVTFLPVAPPSTSAEWLRGASGALVSLKPGQGYDFAIPTKVFAALASGTPVVYAGPGPAAELIDRNAMGWACAYDVGAVADAMISALRTSHVWGEPQRLAAWVEEHRSLAAVAQRSTEVVLAARRR